MKALYLIPFLMFIFLIWAICRAAKRPYTDEEWDKVLEEDFKKYGPVPDPPLTPPKRGTPTTKNQQPTTSNK